MRELGRAEGERDAADGRGVPESQLPSRSEEDRRPAARALDELRLEYARRRHEAREERIAEAAERGVSREEFAAKEEAAREDARQAQELSAARDKIRKPTLWGPPETHEAQRREPYERQDRALEHFRTVPVEGPENTPIDPDRRRRFPATEWGRRDPPFPAGDLSRRDDLVYQRYESSDQERESGRMPEGRTDLAGSTQPATESLQERYPAGVDYTENGHPDLGRYASKTVELRNGFDRPEHAEVDDRANVIFGWERTPEGKTWHKAEDGRTVWLVDAELHEQYGHADEAKDGSLRLSTSNPEHKELLNQPPRDSTVVVDERFTYRTDDRGRVVHASAKLEVVDLDHPRDRSAQANLIGKLPGDHAGHLFARIFQGPGDAINLTPMEGNRVNLSAYKAVENSWRKALLEGKEVRAEVELVYRSEKMRADAFQVTYWIDGKIHYDVIHNRPARTRGQNDDT
ncbi:DNA/RNA non-specific endonuclease [Microlunatus sp. GCM10028923]|uniref:DNA/RNA non-specific endonuclease n=1 Tax=Microlunatus sp. GCM10028923 TaxID=3273400 RepID=UPI003611DEBE